MSAGSGEKVYVKLISAEGQEFFVDKEIAMVSFEGFFFPLSKKKSLVEGRGAAQISFFLCS